MSSFPDDLLLRSRIVLRESHLAAIGAVAAESAYLEQQIELITWKLSGLDVHRGPMFTAGMSLGARISLLRSVGERLLSVPTEAERLGVFAGLLNEMDACASDRNTIVHGIWASAEKDYLRLLRLGPEGVSPASASLLSKRLKTREISADAIQEVARRLADLRNRLGTFYSDVWSTAVLSGPPEIL
jgi:hypothetical protein